MPVVPDALLTDCRLQLAALEADLKAQVSERAELEQRLRDEWATAREAGRVGDVFEIWLGEQATQAAAHWVLGSVFVRFLEDNRLVVEPWISGPGERLNDAESREATYYRDHPLHNERDWLLQAFRGVAALPGGAMLFDEAHNPIFRWPTSPDAAKALVAFWRRREPATGELAHDFADSELQTRFLGDLYQEVSESARKKYALLQTPVFVEEFILDRTLGEAMQALPLEKVTLIDPACGSGHFLLGAFARLLASWEVAEPGTAREVLAQRALNQVAGVDLNPFAVAIARFRLLVAALRACYITRLDRAPAFRMQVVVGDSLLHGADQIELALGDEGVRRRMTHAFSDEDLAAVNAVLDRRYSVVVGNPPYITPKDKALNAAYRGLYRSCHMKYALSVPFVERFWQLAATEANGGVAGWVGQITASSFMKREFGKKLVEEFFPSVDLTHVADTAGAYIPGHGTPTVILFGRSRRPQSDLVRTVMGIRGEPATPTNAAHGVVWTAMLSQIDAPGSTSAFVSVADVARETFRIHPWSIGGGGAAELRELIEASSETVLDTVADGVGVSLISGEDDALIADARYWRRAGLPCRPVVSGDEVRDWVFPLRSAVFFPYSDDGTLSLIPVSQLTAAETRLWPHRTTLRARVMFGKLPEDVGLAWYEIRYMIRDRVSASATIVYAFVATHNHFALDHATAVFKQSALVIKLPSTGSNDVHLGLLGLLNSSTTCFWLKQVVHNAGSTVDQHGARQRTAPFEDFFQFNAAKVAAIPIASRRPSDLGFAANALARERLQLMPAALSARFPLARDQLDVARDAAEALLARMVAVQEELDWRCYSLYGITNDDLTYRDISGSATEAPPLELGERAFEIALARRMAAGDEQTTWFSRHGSTPITEIPAHWPNDYRAIVERRIAAIELDRNIGLIEQPVYKRRWNTESWDLLEREALGQWLLSRLESSAYWPEVELQTTRNLATRAALDSDFGAVAALWTRDAGAALEPVIRELVLGDAVPFLPVLRYSDSGREKRLVWERTWELQRQEDAVDASVAAELRRYDAESEDAFAKRLAAAQRARREVEIGSIPRPPKYTSKDFQSSTYWKLRGALDVPKERFIVYSLCGPEGDDAPLLGWAGWSYLQQAQALAAAYVTRTQTDGWRGTQLVPLLSGVAELVPWLQQWHNQLDPEYGQRLGDFYAAWLEEEIREQGLDRADLAAWTPPNAHRTRVRRAPAGIGE